MAIYPYTQGGCSNIKRAVTTGYGLFVLLSSSFLGPSGSLCGQPIWHLSELPDCQSKPALLHILCKKTAQMYSLFVAKTCTWREDVPNHPAALSVGVKAQVVLAGRATRTPVQAERLSFHEYSLTRGSVITQCEPPPDASWSLSQPPLGEKWYKP